MTTWQAILLGLVQGLTEFLPVSSSGHLALAQHFFGFDSLHRFILFNMICHLGTLGAIFVVFFSEIKDSVTGNYKLFWQVVLGTLPLIPLVLILKPLKAAFDRPELLGPCFLFTSALLFTGLRYRFPLKSSYRQRIWKDSLTVGIFQAIAIFPGISRSGSTVSAARILSWPKEKAISFSFLLAIPAILGGTLLEARQVWNHPESTIALDPTLFIAGFLTSFVAGFFTLKFLIRAAAQNKWNYFAWYCLGLGIFTTFYFMNRTVSG